MSDKFVYMDYNATTPVDAEVVKAMLPYFSEKYGNASSKHHFGNESSAAVEHSRKQISGLIHCNPKDIIFTSGATESNNLALKGIIESNYKENINIVTTEIEHSSILDVCKSLSASGVTVKYVKPNEYGIVSSEDVENAIDDNTVLVSVMTANNEIGTIQPIPEIGQICKVKNILFHTDAVQAFGKIPIDVNEFNVDLMSISAHKIYGPKGTGALYVNSNKKIKLAEQINGGGHEHGFRSGTLNTPGIVGFGKAAEIASSGMYADFQKEIVQRDILTENFLKRISFTYLNGSKEKRLPNNVSISFEGVESGVLLSHIKNIALSTGSACSSATLQPSHVLKAIGKSDSQIKSAVRFGIGRETTNEEINYVIEKVVEAVNRLRG
ncbi:MAG: cysteine desulfurase family protein [Ignavibacteriota bacterium]